MKSKDKEQFIVSGVPMQISIKSTNDLKRILSRIDPRIDDQHRVTIEIKFLRRLIQQSIGLMEENVKLRQRGTK